LAWAPKWPTSAAALGPYLVGSPGDPKHPTGAAINFNHALRSAVAALAIVAAAGCGPQAQTPSSGGAPTLSGDAPEPSSAPTVTPRDPTYGANAELSDARAKEAALLRAIPNEATREGGVLTLYSAGKAVARFVDADTPWSLAETLQTPATDGERSYFKVLQILIDEEGRTEAVEHWFDSAGRFLPTDTVFGQSPRKNMIAAGAYDPSDGASIAPHLSLMEWGAEPPLVYPFKSPCHPIKWMSDVELEAACPYQYLGNRSGADEIVSARVTRVGPRQWRLKQAGLPTRNMPTPPQLAPFDETVTAVEIAPDHDREAVLSENGYARLVK
jgi:hypothetical protein